MFDIKCKRINCKFNENCFCTSKNLEVTKNTECKTYKPSEIEPVSMEAKLGQPPIRKDISVLCKANCLFNDEQVCIANGITIQTIKTENCPNCCTFKPN